jgi:DNA-binding transcriptional MerR regulator
MTTGRTYLSIGDVLTLLRQEFPDVTISKIRFLESQGLVNPERTPSGYRKFYDHDVERLRWVLRQQREHFLPLKVIKGRLEDVVGETVAEETPTETRGNGRHQIESPEIGVVGTSVAGAVALASTKTAAARRSHQAGGDREPSGLGLVGQLPGFHPESAAETGATHPAPPTATATATAPTAASPTAAAPSVPALKSATQRGDEPGSAQIGQDRGPGGALRPGPRRFTATELAEAAGLTESDVSELASFGILVGKTVGGIVHFDESELAVAELAAAFGQFGIEPRHLRLYKHASDREAGFVEQLVLPLLKQRNPDARKRAAEMSTELARLGQGLRRALVQRSLQDLLGR